jgi:hypothetical protein
LRGGISATVLPDLHSEADMSDFPPPVPRSSGSFPGGDVPLHGGETSGGRRDHGARPAAAWPASRERNAPPARAPRAVPEADATEEDADDRAATAGQGPSRLRRASLPASRSSAATDTPDTPGTRRFVNGFGDAGLYVSRLVIPGVTDQIRQVTVDTLKARGLDVSKLKMVPDELMHVTIVRSPNSLREGETLELQHDDLTIGAQGSRQLKRLGDGIVLAFEAKQLHERWAQARTKGAGWLYPGDYIAHVSVCYNAQHLRFDPIDVDSALPITLSGERAEPFNGNWVPDNKLD